MSHSNGSSEPTERTSLLHGDTKKSIEPTVTASGDAVSEEGADEEAGSIEAAAEENPLFEGNLEMRRLMIWLFPAVSVGVLLSAADQTLVVTTYGKIGSDLNALNNTSWIATAYFLTLTSFQPLYGKLSDIFGRKPALLFAYTVFGLGCAFCGLARNLEELIAARAFAGIGGGGMTTVVSIIMSDIVPLRQRGSWQGYMNLVYATGASAGAPLGGLLADSVGWRWAFLGQSPVCLLAILTVYFILDLPQPTTSHWRSKLAQIDFLGALALIVAVSTLLIGLDHGSNVSWTSRLAISCCATSIPLFALFIFIEMRIASHPFAPGRIIFTTSLFSSYASNFFNMAAYMCTIFYVPLYLQVVHNLSATGAGWRLIGPMVLSVSGSLFGGHVMQRTGRYYWLTIGCFGASIVGSVTVFLSSRLLNTPWVLLIGLSCMSFGGGAVITTTLINVIANASSADQAIATACTYLFRSLGSVVGVSLGSTIVQQSLRMLLRERLDGDKVEWIVDGVRKSLEFIKELDKETRMVVVGCYKGAVSGAFGLTIGLVLLALLSACWIREKRLSK